MDDGWQSIQAAKKGFDLNKIFNEEFLNKLEESFENVNINVINVGIALINKDISPLIRHIAVKRMVINAFAN